MLLRLSLSVAGLAIALAGCTSSLSEDVFGSGEADMAAGDCGAAERQALVGESFTVLNDAELPENRRVLFPGAAVTEEFDGSRLNITIGTDDRISQVYCG